MKTRSTFLTTVQVMLLAYAAGLGISQAAEGTTERLNVVLFVADDHGQDAGCYGNKVIRTPNLDQLASEGTLFRQAFCTTASCSASRSVILSGLHNHANGQFGHQHSYHHFSAFSSVKSLPVLMSEAGYRTGRIGKFHVAPESVFKFEKVLPDSQGSRNSVQLAENCREFITDRSRPFFLYICTSDPHRGGGKLTNKLGEPDAFGNSGKYAGVNETTYDPQQVIVPSWLPDNPACRAELAEYYQAVSRVDQGIGRLIQVLKEANQYEKTIFIYTSDNGCAMPGSKTTLYEPGMRLPLIVRHPHAQRRSVQSDAMISWVDFAPTILHVAGVEKVTAPPLVQGESETGAPAKKKGNAAEYKFHGRSFLKILEQEKPAGWNEVFASHTFHEIQMYYPMRVIRTERYKLILNVAHPLPFPFASDLFAASTWQSVLKAGSDARYGQRRVADFVHRPQYELYDLQSDPYEAVNLAKDSKHQAVFQELAAKLKGYQHSTRDPWLLKYEYE